VFVGNLSYDVTREELLETFGAAGKVVDAKVPTDRETGRPRGFAFVEFEDEESAQKSIGLLHGKDLKGRALRVNEAEDRPPRPAGSGPGGGGGGGGGYRPSFGGGGGGGGYRSGGPPPMLPPPDFPGEFPDLGARFNLYLDWLNQPGVEVLRFEDFALDRRKALLTTLTYSRRRGVLLKVTEDDAIEKLSQAIDPSKSHTYRRGAVGDWQTHFTPPIKKLFKDVAGDLLIRLGYEADLDW
jgi:hypothetical protein